MFSHMCLGTDCIHNYLLSFSRTLTKSTALEGLEALPAIASTARARTVRDMRSFGRCTASDAWCAERHPAGSHGVAIRKEQRLRFQLGDQRVATERHNFASTSHMSRKFDVSAKDYGEGIRLAICGKKTALHIRLRT